MLVHVTAKRLSEMSIIYKFSKAQSWSVILHRMYFHCRSLEKKKKKR